MKSARAPKRPNPKTPRRPGWFGATVLHVSMPLARVTDPDTKVVRMMTMRDATGGKKGKRGETFAEGRNQQKRTDWRGSVKRRLAERAAREEVVRRIDKGILE